MAQKSKYAGTKCLRSTIKHDGHFITLYMYRGCDLVHGRGWFVHSYFDTFYVGIGFHKTNRFTAVRQSLKHK